MKYLNEILIEWNDSGIEDNGIIKSDDVKDIIAHKMPFNIEGIKFNMIYVKGFPGGDFWIGETPVTQELWTAVLDDTISPSYLDPDAPMDWISWNDCQMFISNLNKLTGKKFRLPSMDEWVFAANEGETGDRYRYAGSNNLDEVGWYFKNCNHIMSVKLLKPNELGIYDMSGNVEEWTSTPLNKYEEWNRKYATLGGCCGFSETGCVTLGKNPWKNFYNPDFSSGSVGFRLALT